MSRSSSIEWTEASWNPVTGCSKVSPGCKNCYAERMARRLNAMGQYNYRNGFQTTCHEHVLGLPLTWKKPQIVFVNSMSDLFHEDVPAAFIHSVFDVMREASWHTFQVLTKRSERLLNMDPEITWPGNVWMGVSIEANDFVYRARDISRTGARVRFLSLEPLLESLPSLSLDGIQWVIAGGESGPRARPMKKEWVMEIRDLCSREQVPFFFKQWGGTRKKYSGRILEGRTWDDLPATPVLT